MDELRSKRLDEIHRLGQWLRDTMAAPAYRVWFCPFSSNELHELVCSVGEEEEMRRVMYASSTEQLRDAPSTELTLLHRSDDGEHPRWDAVTREHDPPRPRAPLWEADLIHGDDARRVGVITLFDPEGSGLGTTEMPPELREQVRDLVRDLGTEVDAYRRLLYDMEVLGAIQPSITGELSDLGGATEVSEFFAKVATWFRSVAWAGGLVEGTWVGGGIEANACALFIKEENRLVQVDATADYRQAALAAGDPASGNVLTSVPLDGSEPSLLSFAYEVMSREHLPLAFPSGRSDGATVASLLGRLQERVMESVGDGDGGLSPDAWLARKDLRHFLQRIKEHGSCGFFPLMRREEVEGVLVMFASRRTFFYPANVLLGRAITSRLGRFPDLLPDHRQDKDYRDRKTRLTYIEQRHQHVDSYLTGGQRVQAVAFLNLVGFRELNDIYGHRVGDRVLESMMEGLAIAAHQPELLDNRHAALQLVEQEKSKIDAEQYAATELSKKRRRRKLEVLPLHYGGDEFGLVLLGKDEGEDAGLVARCQRVVNALLGYLRFRLAGQVDAGRVQLRSALALPSALDDEGENIKNDFALYTALRELGRSLMYYTKGIDGLNLYCPGYTVLEHRFELELDEGGPGVWRAVLISPRGGGDRVPMSGDILQLDLLQSLDRTVGRHIRAVEDRDAVIRRIQKMMTPVRFEVLSRLPGVGTRTGRGVRDQYLLRQLDFGGDVRVQVGDHLFGNVRI
ncbi:nucleotidyl cyclase domain-containing protein [Paraliomyxa miuraensis]|uniref:hypothetical protein n=1 Tax=Paraliomyxa miuraensis TaxID=376150 RepID=UPI002256F4EC|nr:hypothetical protein [Paraliomyxa miuraensis]MCX4244030.1 hypothetical protein [Paraliomyxa miuraensis]